MKTMKILGLALGGLLCLPPAARAISPETQLLLDLLQAKGVISAADAQSFRQTIEARLPETDNDGAHGSVQGLAQRVEKLEEAREAGLGGLGDKVHLSGVVEFEGQYVGTEPQAGASTDTTTLALAKGELHVDVDVAEQVSGHLALLYEDDNALVMDEAFIRLSGPGTSPFSLQAGKQVIPFGRFESHFISDPITLTLGESRETALVAGYARGPLDLAFGFYNGAIGETAQDDIINSFVASAVLAGALSPDLNVTAGVSYISNLADSNTLQDTTTGTGLAAATVTDLVGGFSAFVSAVFQEKLFLEAEYLGATDDFLAGEVAYSAAARSPSAWNLELGYALTDRLEAAIKYEGSDDFDNVAPEEQYGVAFSYALFERTSLAIEYLKGDMANNNDVDTITVQLAIEY